MVTQATLISRFVRAYSSSLLKFLRTRYAVCIQVVPNGISYSICMGNRWGEMDEWRGDVEMCMRAESVTLEGLVSHKFDHENGRGLGGRVS